MTNSGSLMNKHDNLSCGDDLYFENGWLYRRHGIASTRICNYQPRIILDVTWDTEDDREGRFFVMEVCQEGRTVEVQISVDEFFGQKLSKRITEVVGPTAITLGSAKDLRIAIQQLSAGAYTRKFITASLGFRSDGNFLFRDMLIRAGGEISEDAPVDFDDGGAHRAKHLRFLTSENTSLEPLVKHLLADFLELKPHSVMYPLTGYVMLAPFSSQILKVTGKNKPAMHLVGPSGGGKTFLGATAMCFFGLFDDALVSWSSTANAIEAEGHYFRDCLFLVNDYKASRTDSKTAVRIFQNYADESGRSRLKPDSQIQAPSYIRGLLLSTGEDFLTGVESVTARTILLNVGPEKNIVAGNRCREMRKIYPMLLPSLISMVIAEENWQDRMRGFVDRYSKIFCDHVTELSNGLRIASNWALNAFGFSSFLRFAQRRGIIDENEENNRFEEYLGIVIEHLQHQASALEEENPATAFFRIIGEKFDTGSIFLLGDNKRANKGKAIGKIKQDSLFIFPDAVMATITTHYHSIDEKRPFSKEALRDALVRQGLLKKPSQDRWAKQIRVNGNERIMAWEFDTEEFLQRCGLKEG